MNTVDCETVHPNEYLQTVRTRSHQFGADVGPETGSADAAPGPHDYFDTALAACKTLTATWYARRHKIPLERVESHVERDDAQERAGTYKLRVRLAFHGAALTDEHRAQLHRAVSACPIHKLMTTSDVVIETVSE